MFLLNCDMKKRLQCSLSHLNTWRFNRPHLTPPRPCLQALKGLTEVEQGVKMQTLLTLKWPLSPRDCYFSMVLMLLLCHLLTRRASAPELAWKTSASAMTWKHQEANSDPQAGISLWATCIFLQKKKKKSLYSCTEMFLKWVCSTSAVHLRLLLW